jgi:phenylacetate-CoA ligase
MSEVSESTGAGIELSVIVPCFNEELNVPELTRRVLKTLDAGQVRGEIVLVDDGSRDRTRDVIEEHMRLDPARVVGVFHEKNAGMAAAWRSGVNAARGANVATIDADLQYQPEDLLRLYRTLIESSVDIVQGYRSSVGRLRDGRFVLSRGLNILLNGSFGMNLRDNKSGFVCCAKEVLQDLLRYKGHYSYWQSFIMVAAHTKGYSYREIETLFEDRKQGQSFLDGQAYRASARNFVDVGRAFWEYRLNAEPRDPALKIFEPGTSTLPRAPAGMTRRLHVRARSLPLHANARTVRRSFETLDATQWMTPAQIRELQAEKLRRLIRHAYRTVPFYRAHMQARGLRPEDVRTLEDLRLLPLLTRKDVRHHLYFDIVQEGVSPAELARVQSSGKSGEPSVGYVGYSDLAFRLAAALRAHEWTGCRLAEPSVCLTNESEEVPLGERLRQALESVGARRTMIDVGSLDQRRLDQLVGRIRRLEPALIEGSVEVLAALAEHVGGARFGQAPRAVMSTGQSLTSERRALIEAGFGCRVFDRYGSGEFGGIACETGTPGEHLVFAESCIVELLVDGRPARPGEIGDVVVTDLNNRVMPFIRYSIGDRAEALDDSSPSPCGRGLPRIGAILGRAESIIRGLDGRFVPGSFFDTLMQDYYFAVEQFRVVQEQPGALTVQIVKSPRYSRETLDIVQSKIREALGAELRIDLSLNDPSPPDAEPAPISRIPVSFPRSVPKPALRRSGR